MSAPARILIVDDDPNVLEALSTALVPPHEALTARTGLRALELVGQQALDLVLLDYLLPDVSGLMILSILRQAYPSLPVLLMTGFGSEEVAVEAFRRGVRDYLKKPIDLRDLVVRVAALLAASRQSDKPAPSLGWKVGRPPPVGDRVTHDAGLRRAIMFIEGQSHTELRLDQVAREAGMSKFHFCRHFKERTGLTFREFLARRRIARAVELLQDQTRSVSEVYLDVGFKNPSHFSRVFLKLTGQSPSRYRRTIKESR